MTDEEIDLTLATLMEPEPKWMLKNAKQISVGRFWEYQTAFSGIGNYEHFTPAIPRSHKAPECFSMVVNELLSITDLDPAFCRRNGVDICTIYIDSFDSATTDFEADNFRSAAALALIRAKQ